MLEHCIVANSDGLGHCHRIVVILDTGQSVKGVAKMRGREGEARGDPEVLYESFIQIAVTHSQVIVLTAPSPELIRKAITSLKLSSRQCSHATKESVEDSE